MEEMIEDGGADDGACHRSWTLSTSGGQWKSINYVNVDSRLTWLIFGCSWT
jgi:hypothetical protein